jgi:hypothetical protein
MATGICYTRKLLWVGVAPAPLLVDVVADNFGEMFAGVENAFDIGGVDIFVLGFWVFLARHRASHQGHSAHHYDYSFHKINGLGLI